MKVIVSNSHLEGRHNPRGVERVAHEITRQLFESGIDVYVATDFAFSGYELMVRAIPYKIYVEPKAMNKKTAISLASSISNTYIRFEQEKKWFSLLLKNVRKLLRRILPLKAQSSLRKKIKNLLEKNTLYVLNSGNFNESELYPIDHFTHYLAWEFSDQLFNMDTKFLSRSVKIVTFVYDYLYLRKDPLSLMPHEIRAIHLATQASLKSDAFIFCSDLTKKDHYRIFPTSSKSSVVVNFGFDHKVSWENEKAKSNDSHTKVELQFEDEFRLLLLGDLDYRKNFNLVLKALEHISQMSPEIKIRIDHIGNNANLDISGSLLSKLSEKYKIVFHGWVSDSIRNYYLSNCDLFLFPSVIEGYGFPVLEALSMGTPVLSSNRVPSALLLDSVVKLASPFDPMAWGIKIIEVYKEKSKTDKQTLKNSVARFTWESCVENIINWLDVDQNQLSKPVSLPPR